MRVSALMICCTVVFGVGRTAGAESGSEADESPPQTSALRETVLSPAELAEAVKRLRNTDLDWVLNPSGEMLPLINTESAAGILSAGRTAVPLLVNALESPDQFAVAHVLLCQIYDRGGCCFRRTADGFEAHFYNLVAIIRFQKDSITTKTVEYPEERNYFIAGMWSPIRHYDEALERTKRRREEPPVVPTQKELEGARAALKEMKDRELEWWYSQWSVNPILPELLRTSLHRVGQNLIPELLAALDDPERTVCAHVILTSLYRENAVSVSRRADGTQVIFNNLSVTMNSQPGSRTALNVAYPDWEMEQHWIRFMWHAIFKQK